VHCQLKWDAEGLRKKWWSQKASVQTAQVNFVDCPDEVMVYGLSADYWYVFSEPQWLLGVVVRLR